MLQIAPGPYAPPPYEQTFGGPVYFKILPGIQGLNTLWADALRMRARLIALQPKHPAATRKRQLLDLHLANMRDEIRAGELFVAQKCDEYVRARIKDTQRRPDRSGRMYRGIESRPIPYPLVPAFSVGLVDISILDKATTERSGKPYWRTQEYGYTGHKGRTVRGFFMPGMVRPSASQFRVHPIFRTGTGFGARMTIDRPIEERAFLRSGTMQAGLLQARMWNTMQAKAVVEVNKIITFGGPGVRP